MKTCPQGWHAIHKRLRTWPLPAHPSTWEQIGSSEATLGSDHLVILISLQCEIKKTEANKSHYINFKKSGWQKFKQLIEDELANEPPPVSVHKGEHRFRNIVTKAAAQSIPSGCIRQVRPFFPSDAPNVNDERDPLQKTSPGHPRIVILNENMTQKVNDYRRNAWQDHLADVNLKSGVSRLWKTIKNLNSQQKPPANQPIQFNTDHIWNERECSNRFNAQYIPKPTTNSRRTKNIRRSNRKSTNKIQEAPLFSTEEVNTETMKTKASKDLGPGKIASIHLKHLGPSGLRYVTHLINLSYRSFSIPALWETTRIIPLLKPNKPKK